MDYLDISAKLAKSVNCIAKQNNRHIGYNIDGQGLISDLTSKIGSLNDRRILVLGSGGAARGILSALTQESTSVSVWSRNKNISLSLQKYFSLGRLEGRYDVIIHATSAKEQFGLDWLSDYNTKNTFLYDIQYKNNDLPTWFCEWATEHGYRNCDGRGMVYEQAKLAFEIWIKSLD